MLSSSQHFDMVFREAIDSQMDGEATLARIGAICAKCSGRGNQLRQPCPSALPPTSLHTLVQLLQQASHAAPALQRLMEAGIAGKPGCSIVPPPSATKGIYRALEK